MRRIPDGFQKTFSTQKIDKPPPDKTYKKKPPYKPPETPPNKPIEKPKPDLLIASEIRKKAEPSRIELPKVKSGTSKYKLPKL